MKMVKAKRINESLLNDLLEEAVTEGVITCPLCDNKLEPDAEKCSCGWTNILVEGGYIQCQ